MYALLHGSIVQVIPFPLAPRTTMLLLGLRRMVVVISSLDISFGRAFFTDPGLRDGALALVMIVAVKCVTKGCQT